jgi:HK97 family phage prohead protease
MKDYDFCGWATKNNLKCSDGRTIMKDAFKHMDGKVVPLVWNHKHEGVVDVLGHALLENRDEGVYAYGTFNDTESGQTAKLLVQHGDVDALSIFANNLKQNMANVVHGDIREVSLVLAGANPGAFIESVVRHGEESEEEARIFTGEYISLEDNIQHAEPEASKKDDNSEKKPEDNKDSGKEKTFQEVFDSMNEDQKTFVYALLGSVDDDSDDEEPEKEESKGGNETMKHNVFDGAETENKDVLSHSDQEAIVELAKQSGVGSLKAAMEIYANENEQLAHGFENYDQLFPEYELTKKGAPELLERDQSWIAGVMGKIHKSPISRIRTRQADSRIAELRAKGYQNKGDEKKVSANIKLLSRTTDPQTVYIKDNMHRDDIIDITDFDVVEYQWNVMRHTLNEELALAALIGDGREEGDPDKIHETHIRSIWNDDELYTIHKDVDIAAAKAELQGTNTGANFGENYIYAEAIITAALYSREKYKGSGTPDLYCTPHLLNVMLLARDLNGRRIYDSKSDLAAALNVGEIYTVEQFEGRTRTTSDGKTKKLLGLFVNLADYQFGSTRGGEITKFEDFDIDFNRYKYLLETRLSGALTKVYSAIALEEPVSSTTASDQEEPQG